MKGWHGHKIEGAMFLLVTKGSMDWTKKHKNKFVQEGDCKNPKD